MSAEPLRADAAIQTIAELPFLVMGRSTKAQLVGRASVDGIAWLSAKELFERIRDFSLGLSALGVGPGDRVAIVAESRPEWVIADLATLCCGAVTVPIYPTLSAPQARYILRDSGASVAIFSTRTQLEKVQDVRHQLPALGALVLMDGFAPTDSPSVLSFESVAERGHTRMTGEWGAGKEFRDRTRAIEPDQLATIIYTSGTTGEPKGVMLTHANLVSNLLDAEVVLEISHEDLALSFLPLSHGFERIASFVFLYVGMTIVFAESFDTIGRDIKAARPTIVTAVPRVFEKVQARVTEKGLAEGGLKTSIFRWAIGVGEACARAQLRGKEPGLLDRLQANLANRLVFEQIREGLGGRIRFFVSGSAPLAVSTAEFFYGVGLPILEGYGLTETSPALAVNPLHAPRAGTVGPALPSVELRIAEDGEILARGPNVMQGYYNKPDATAEALKDGWFHTGDIGTIDAEGYLKITDRKKDLIVTSGGKKIAPQPLEEILKHNPLVAEAVLLGDRQKFIVALIIPNFAMLERRLKELGRPPGTREELVVRPDVLALYQEIIDGINRELAQYERIKKIAILPTEFSIASGELTPTLKVKRRVVEERWANVIERLYNEP